jgi:hypothetical protein
MGREKYLYGSSGTAAISVAQQQSAMPLLPYRCCGTVDAVLPLLLYCCVFTTAAVLLLLNRSGSSGTVAVAWQIAATVAVLLLLYCCCYTATVIPLLLYRC